MNYQDSLFKSALSYEGKVLESYKLKIAEQTKLLRIIKSALPDSLSSHALFCVGSEDKVLLYTDSSVWSSQLRFYQQTILQLISDKNPGTYQSIQIKITPKTIDSYVTKKIKRPSPQNISLILSQAEMQSDEQLKQALFKLGKTLSAQHNRK